MPFEVFSGRARNRNPTVSILKTGILYVNGSALVLLIDDPACRPDVELLADRSGESVKIAIRRGSGNGSRHGLGGRGTHAAISAKAFLRWAGIDHSKRQDCRAWTEDGMLVFCAAREASEPERPTAGGSGGLNYSKILESCQRRRER